MLITASGAAAATTGDSDGESGEEWDDEDIQDRAPVAAAVASAPGAASSRLGINSEGELVSLITNLLAKGSKSKRFVDFFWSAEQEAKDAKRRDGLFAITTDLFPLVLLT